MAMFAGKTVCITGAASGLGRGTAVAFAREGANVVVADVAEAGGQETVAMIKKDGGTAVFQRTDVRKAGDAEAMVRLAVQQFGRLDCAFNNAGIAPAASHEDFRDGVRPLLQTADHSELQWDEIQNVNLKGVFLCMKYELQQMLVQGGGRIVNTSSIAALRGAYGGSAYNAAKAGVSMLTKTAAREYGGRGVRVNAVCPGFMDTPMVHKRGRSPEELRADKAKQTPVGRMGQPEDIAQAVLWLCSDQASYVNGHLLVVDGGVIA